MKYLKLFESDKDKIITKENFENHTLAKTDVPMFKLIPDNRDTAKAGDIALAIWFPDETWYAFKVEDLGDDNGFGFGGDGKVGQSDTVYQIEAAYHCIVLK